MYATALTRPYYVLQKIIPFSISIKRIFRVSHIYDRNFRVSHIYDRNYRVSRMYETKIVRFPHIHKNRSLQKLYRYDQN